ncbi:MAG: hypothetical protein BMS9Abin13_134 [Patescibacteria group bacterium]|nr:MAG: hypothetical protein BMS9Abin13_134 [Patescibacteria group bacterium]
MSVVKALLTLDKKFAELVSGKTKRFIETRIGKIFLSLMLIGPITFLPTVWEAWTASNIDVLRTLTWPTMLIVNVASYISFAHNGSWRARAMAIEWFTVIALIWLATIVR